MLTFLVFPKSYRSFAVILLLALVVPLFRPFPAVAQEQITDLNAPYEFGKEIVFKARLAPGITPHSAQLLFKKEGDSGIITMPAQVGQAGDLEAHYDLKSTAVGEIPPRPFAKVVYWFQVVLQNGETLASPENTFAYEDNRFTWSTKEKPPFRVHWYAGDEAFVQRILDAAQEGLQKTETGVIPLQVKDKIDIYAYASSADMQAVEVSPQSWVAGQALPDLNTIVASLPPASLETRLEIRRKIPHELVHILLYQVYGSRSQYLPVWLNEGLASMAELNPNPDYQAIIQQAIKNKTLIPLHSLCQSFPTDISSVLLSYAEAHYFTVYLRSQYGSSGLASLISRYVDGQDCQRAVEMSFGVPLDRLESRWLQEMFGRNEWSEIIGKLLPWVAIFFLIVAVPLLLTFGGMLSGRRSSSGNRQVELKL
jgi:hypothetical protein